MQRSNDDWRVRVAARTDVGPVRVHNEDAVAILVPGEAPTREPQPRRLSTARGVGLLVLDGMGGQSSGAIPCSLALDSLSGAFAAGMPEAEDLRGAWLVDTLRRASEHLKAQGTAHAGQGAAAALAVVHGATLHVVHAGDVRLYLLRDGRLELRTRDDSLLNLALDAGVTEPQLSELPRGILTQSLGHGDVDGHLQSFALVEGDVLLLCSDGLYASVPAATLAATMRTSDDPAKLCAALVGLAVAANSSDNISALVARLERS